MRAGRSFWRNRLQSYPHQRRRGLSAAALRVATLLRTPLYANALYLWAGAGLAAAAGLAFWALVARLYGADEVGLGSAALSGLTLLAMFSHLGLGLGLVRFLPESGTHGPRLANAVFTASAAAAVVLAAVFLLGLPLWASSLGFLREPLYSVAFVAFVVAATSIAVTDIRLCGDTKGEVHFRPGRVGPNRTSCPAGVHGGVLRRVRHSRVGWHSGSIGGGGWLCPTREGAARLSASGDNRPSRRAQTSAVFHS